MEKLQGSCFLTSKGFSAFVASSVLACRVCLLHFCGGLFAVDPGNAVGEWGEYVGWERCVDGVTGEHLREMLQATVCLPPRAPMRQNGC